MSPWWLFALQIILNSTYQILFFLLLLLYCLPFHIWVNIAVYAVTLEKTSFWVRAFCFLTPNLDTSYFLIFHLKKPNETKTQPTNQKTNKQKTQPQKQTKIQKPQPKTTTKIRQYNHFSLNLCNYLKWLLCFDCNAFSQTDFIEHYNYTGSFQCIGRDKCLALV